MDFYAMKRKQLQSLCKKHGIPANLRNVEMADRLALLLKEDEQPIEPDCRKFEENEGEFDSDVEMKKVKRVRFSPENQTHYFVGTDNDSDADCEYNSRKKVGTKRKSMVAKGVSKKKVLENPGEVQPLVEMIDLPGIVTRSRRQTMVKGDAQAIFSPPAANKKKVKTAVRKVDVWDTSQVEDEFNVRADGSSQGGRSSGGLVQIHLRSRMVDREEKNQVPKKTKVNKASDGNILPVGIDAYNAPARTAVQPEKIQKSKGNVKKVEDSTSVVSEKSSKIHLGGRITRSRTQVEEKNCGVETEEGICEVRQKCAEALQHEQTFKGPDRNYFRRKSADPLTKSVHDEELAADANEPEKKIRRSKRNLARDKVSVCRPLADTKVARRSKKLKSVFVGKALGGKECLEVPKIEEPSKSTSITTSRRKFPVVQNGKELKTGDTRKRPRNTDSGKASHLEQSMETIGQSVVLPPNTPLRRSRRRTTLLSSAAIDDTELRICEAAATVEESTESVLGKASNVTRTQMQSSGNVPKQIVIEAKMDRFCEEATLEKESSYLVNDSLYRSSERRSSRNVSKLNFAAPTRFAVIAAGKNKESESRTPVTAEEVLCAKLKTPLEKEPNHDVLDVLDTSVYDTSVYDNAIDSCPIRDGVGRTSMKRKKSSKKSKYLNIDDSAGDLNDHSCPSLNIADTGGVVDQIHVECLDKLSDILSPTFTCPSNDESPISQPHCEGERSNLLYSGEAVEADESFTSETTDQKRNVVDDQLAQVSKASILADQNLVDTVLEEALENKEPDQTTETGEVVEERSALSCCDRKEKFQVDNSCLSLNIGATGHDNTVEQNPVECSDKFGNVVTSKYISFGDGHSECDVADDQWEDITKASFPLDQNLVQLGASAVDQPFLVELFENKKPALTTEKSSNTVNGTSDLGRNETVHVDVGSSETAETIPETDGDIHQGETVCSDTVAPSKSPQIKQETVSEDCERKMDSTVLKTTEFQEDEMAITEVTPVRQSLEENDRPITEVQSVCEESDRNAEKSSEVEEEKLDLCPYEGKEMVQPDIKNSVKTAKTIGKTIEEILEDGLVLNDTWLTPPKSSILKQDENQLEAQATVVRESNINHIGQIDSCSNQTDIRDEATSSWTAELLSGHEKSEVVGPKENQFGNSRSTVKILNEESESTERNSKWDDGYARVGENKIHEVIPESIDRTSEGVIEKNVNEDTDEGIGSLFSYEIPHIMSNEGEEFKLPDECRNPRETDEALLHGSKNQKIFDEDCFLEEHTVAASMNIYSNHESSGYAVLDETEPGCLFYFDLVKMQDGDVEKSQGPSDMVMPVGSEALQSAQQLDQLNGYPNMHKEDSPELMNLYPNYESSMKVMVHETDSGSPFVLDLEKLDGNVDKSQGPSNVVMSVDREVVQSVPQLDQLQYGDPYKDEDVSLEMKTRAAFAVDEHMSMDHNVGTLYSGINSNRACSEEIGLGNVNDCLARDELVDPSSCCHAIISSNAVESNMSQIEDNLAGTDGIVDADSIGEVEQSADNACDKPQAGSDLNGSNGCNEGGKRNREEAKNNNDEDSDLLDVTAPFQDVEVALESKAHACSVGVYLDAMNGFNADTSATSRENFEGLSDVPKDNQDLSVEPEIFTHWEMSTVFGDAKKDLSAESVEPFRCYLNNMHSENAMDVADNTKIVQECNQRFFGKQLGDPELNAELVEELPTLEDNRRCNEQKYINYENDKSRNSGVAEGSARAMNSDRMEIQRRETKDSSLQFSSELPRMAYSEPYKSNLLAEGTSTKVANQRSTEVTETRLGKFDEVCFKGGGMLTVVSSERGKCASAAASDSVSIDGKTTETIASTRKMNEESSSMGICFEDKGKHNLDANPAVDPNSIIPQSAATECLDRNNNSFYDAVLVCGHSNNNVASDEVDTRSMEEIDDHRKYDDGTELAEEAQLRLVGGNLSEERKFPDVNSVSGISSSWADRPSDLTVAKHNVSHTCTYPKRRGLPIHEYDKFSMVESISGMKIDEDRNAERSIDYPVNSPVTASSHEMKDLKLNAASSVLNSFEIRLLFKLFSDDNIDGHETSNRDVSKVNSTNAKSEELKKGKESAVVIPQFATGKLTDHEYELEGVDCVDQSITQEMGIHCHGDSAITNFSARGDNKRGDVQNLDAGMITEDVEEVIEDAPGTAQVVIEQLDDHGQRMKAEPPESPHPPVSDEYTRVNEVSKEEGIGPISHEFFACEDSHESGDLQNSYLGIGTGELRDDLELSGRTSAFDVAAATKDHTYSESERNNLIPDVEGTKFQVESDIESELDLTAVQCLTSEHSAFRKENLKLPTKRSWGEDSDKKIIASSARLESKKYGLIPKTPKTVATTFDMKENFISTKSNQFSNSTAKSLQTRKALEDLQK